MDQERLWSEFLEFIERAPAAGHPGELLEGFRDDLITQGMPEEDARAAARAVRDLSLSRSDLQVPMFDRIYADLDPGFRTLPNELLVDTVADRPSGRALDIAMGQGRNAVYLAGIGWQVSGFDVSPQGVAVAEAAAREKGFELDARVGTAEDYDYGTDRWDLIVMTYALVPVTNPDYAATLIDSLRSGGAIVIESFATNPDGITRSVDIDPDAMRSAYGSLKVLRWQHQNRTAEWTLRSEPIIRAVFGK